MAYGVAPPYGLVVLYGVSYGVIALYVTFGGSGRKIGYFRYFGATKLAVKDFYLQSCRVGLCGIPNNSDYGALRGDASNFQMTRPHSPSFPRFQNSVETPCTKTILKCDG
jgi:hypothetical protein